MDGNAAGAIGFMIMIGIFAVMFAVHQAKIDKIRDDSAKRIAGWEADFVRELDEFKVANPTASCRNCENANGYGECEIGIRPRRHFCPRWVANLEHHQALDLSDTTDDQISAQYFNDANRSIPELIRFAELSLATIVDHELRRQVRRILGLARSELARRQQEAERA